MKYCEYNRNIHTAIYNNIISIISQIKGLQFRSISLKLHEIQETAEKLQFVFNNPRAILGNENKVDVDEVNHLLKDAPT